MRHQGRELTSLSFIQSRAGAPNARPAEGPYKVVDSAGGRYIGIHTASDNTLVAMMMATDSLARVRATANLMAASPELLEACKKALKFFEETFFDKNDPAEAAAGEDAGEFLENLLRSAIAKAETT